MKKEYKDALLGMLMLVSVLFMTWTFLRGVYNFGYLAGKSDGRDEQRETTKRIDCEVGFGDKPQYEITGECLKYFKLQEGN
jgi:hypothetical protein